MKLIVTMNNMLSHYDMHSPFLQFNNMIENCGFLEFLNLGNTFHGADVEKGTLFGRLD